MAFDGCRPAATGQTISGTIAARRPHGRYRTAFSDRLPPRRLTTGPTDRVFASRNVFSQGHPGPVRPAAACQRGDQCRVRAEEEIADCRAPAVSDPALRQMVRPIVQHVAALTERTQVL